MRLRCLLLAACLLLPGCCLFGYDPPNLAQEKTITANGEKGRFLVAAAARYQGQESCSRPQKYF